MKTTSGSIKIAAELEQERPLPTGNQRRWRLKPFRNLNNQAPCCLRPWVRDQLIAATQQGIHQLVVFCCLFFVVRARDQRDYDESTACEQ